MYDLMPNLEPNIHAPKVQCLGVKSKSSYHFGYPFVIREAPGLYLSFDLTDAVLELLLLVWVSSRKREKMKKTRAFS